MSRRKICLVLEYTVVIIFLLLVVDFSGVAKHFFELDYSSTFHYPMHGNVLHFARQLRFNKAVDVPPTNTYNYTIFYNSAQKCSKRLAPDSLGVTILIKSAMEHFKRRAIIRKTWGSDYDIGNGVVRSIFLLGNSEDKALEKVIRSESNQYRDIVMADFIDSYYNNTIKTMMGFRWAVEHCPNSTHYLFVDDDYYVSIKNVLRFIKNQLIFPKDSDQQSGHLLNDNSSKWQNFLTKNSQNTFPIAEQISSIPVKLYAGFMLNSSPHRHKLSKWYIDLKEYPFDMWPPYITAGAYILSKEALFEMYFVSMYTKHFRFDDIYLSILALKANINITHCPEFYFNKAKYLEPQNYRNVIASHGYGDPTKLFNTWLECYTAGYA